jgi:hypothetical protein
LMCLKAWLHSGVITLNQLVPPPSPQHHQYANQGASELFRRLSVPTTTSANPSKPSEAATTPHEPIIVE